MCTKILQLNSMGPIVFITPEIGRFSTVGGVGVMVNELTQALAALGREIHIISPYYNFNRKGQTGYLAAEGEIFPWCPLLTLSKFVDFCWLNVIVGIKYVNNVVTYIGNEYVEVGVHYGKEHGVNLHFLHNFKYFTTPYDTGTLVKESQRIECW